MSRLKAGIIHGAGALAERWHGYTLAEKVVLGAEVACAAGALAVLGTFGTQQIANPEFRHEVATRAVCVADMGGDRCADMLIGDAGDWSNQRPVSDMIGGAEGGVPLYDKPSQTADAAVATKPLLGAA